MAELYVGTSGWTYPEWKDGFYAGVPRRRWLAHYAQHFRAVEVNVTFRRTMKPETLARWRDETPDAFRFAIKGHRVVTHVNRLVDVDASIDEQRAGLEPLAGKIGAVLWQTPAKLPKDLALLDAFASALGRWPEVRHVVEFRDPSWFDDDSKARLAARSIASAISDAGRWQRFDAVTTDLAYLRLHGRPETYKSAYGRDGLEAWAGRIRGWLGEGRAVHVYFDNTMSGAAPDDAAALTELLSAG